ncbi:MAG: hypothetical protein ACTSXQ_07040 [Alphaproteobacteria bacterium]
MKKKLIGLIYAAIWDFLWLKGASLYFPILFQNAAIDPLDLNYWYDLYLFFNAGGVMPWVFVTALVSLFFVILIGTIAFYSYGHQIIPAYQKYARKHKKARPLKRRVKEYKSGRRFA